MTHLSFPSPASARDHDEMCQPRGGLGSPGAACRCSTSEETVWRPVKPHLCLFMLSQVTCPVNRLARDVSGLPDAQRLHVRRAGDLLVVTEADDLHCTGKSLFATRLVDFATLSLFRMTLVAPVRIEPSRLRAATGIITLAWRDGRWRMQAVGRLAGTSQGQKSIFDATEIFD